MNNSSTGFRRATLALAVSATLATAVQAQDPDSELKQRASVVEEVFHFC